jgi:hypothetical protein
LYEQACALRRRFDAPVTIRHVRRAQNKRADELCNEALDGKRCAMPRAATLAAEIAKTMPPPNVHEEALKFLRKAAAAWSRSDGEPTPEQVWQRLTEILERYGVKLPSS